MIYYMFDLGLVTCYRKVFSSFLELWKNYTTSSRVPCLSETLLHVLNFLTYKAIFFLLITFRLRFSVLVYKL